MSLTGTSFPEESWNLRAWREALYNAVPSKRNQADEIAEEDLNDWEKRAEASSGDRIIDDFLYKQGVDPKDDPWKVFKMIDGQTMGRDMLGRRGDLRIESNNENDFKKWAETFNGAVVDPWVQNLNNDYLLDDLVKYRDNRDLARIENGLKGGLSFGQHSDRMLSVIKGGTESLDIGEFLFDTPTELDAVMQMVGKTDMRVRLNAPFSTTSKVSAKLLGDALGDNFSLSPGGVTDHFKVFAANIQSKTIESRSFLVGSINATNAAIGRAVGRSGRNYSTNGTNLESSFLLNYSLVNQGFMSRDTFIDLTDQAARAMEWVHSGQLGTATDFASTSSGLSRILTGAGSAEAHLDLLSAISDHGSGKARIITYNIGNQLLAGVEKAIVNGGTVDILLGSRYDFSATRGISMTATSAGKTALEDFKRNIIAKYGDRADDILSRLNVTIDHANLVHAKVSVFEVNGATITIDSTGNLDDKQVKADTSYRNLAIALHSGDGDGVEKLTAQSARAVQQMIRTASWMTPYAAGTSGMITSTGGERQLDVDLLSANLANLESKYKLQSGSFSLIHNDEGVHVQANIGGTVEIKDFNGKSSYLNLGNLMTLTMVQSELGYGSQVYVPELSKFVGGVIGLTATGSNKLEQGAKGPEAFGASEVIASGMRAINEQVVDQITELARRHGTAYVDRILRDPYERAKLVQAIRTEARDVFKNFAGHERGTAAYSAKEFARLAYLVDKAGNLNLLPNPDIMLDAKTVDRAVSGKAIGRGGGYRMLLASKAEVDPKTGLTVKEAIDLVFSAGGLSRFEKGGSTTARMYDMAMMERLPMAARMKRDGQEDGPYEYLFLLPAAKLEQLPQRLQNIMSARNLNPITVNGIDNNMSSYSRISQLGEDGTRSRMLGIRMNMYMIPGMTGDNSYVIGERVRGQYSADDSVRFTANIEMANLRKESMSMMQDQLEDLVHRGLAVREGNRFTLNSASFEALKNHDGTSVLSLALHNMPGSTATTLTQLDIGTLDPNQVLILDLEPGRGVSSQRGIGKFTFTLMGQFGKTVTSGERTLLGGKAPINVIQEASPAFQALQGMVERTSDSRVLAAMGFDRGNVTGFMGSGTIKYGQAFLETGIQAIESGAVRMQLEALMAKSGSRTLQDVLKGTTYTKKGKIKAIDFTGLYERLAPFMDMNEAMEVTRALSGARDVRDIMAMFEETRSYIDRNGSIGLGVKGELKHISAAAMAFGIHALYFMEAQAAELDNLRSSIDLSDGSGSNAVNMSTLQMLGAVPLSYVTSISAAATAMSSRNRVNFLNYHSGGYTDAFFDVMALDSKVTGRAGAFKELVMGGLLGRGPTNEIVMARHDTSVMTLFQVGYENEFSQLLRYQRELQGFHGNITKERVAVIQTGIAEILGKMNDKKKLAEAGVNPEDRVLFQTPGSMSSAFTQSFLRTQEMAGISDVRTVMLPQIGYTDERGVFVADPHRAETVRQKTIRLLSPKALKTLGSFEDFSHRIQVLQVEIERRLGELRGLPSDPEKLRSLSYQHRVAYSEIMALAGELEVEQRKAAATQLQKSLGGQLAMQGVNMLAGTLPELKAGWMLLGEKPWQQIKTGLKAEIGRALERTSDNLDLISELNTLVDALGERTGRSVTDIKDRLAGLGGDDTELRERYSEIGEDIKGRKHSRTLRGGATVGSINTYISALKLERNVVKNKILSGQMEAVDTILEELLGDIDFRSELARGMFQRAGAPMGPFGITFTKMLLVDEYNAVSGRKLLLDKEAAHSAMWIFSGAMGVNLGDFDGDTASISWLQKYTELNAIEMIQNQAAGKYNVLKGIERNRLSALHESQNFSTEEIYARFTRATTGMYSMFSDEALYGGKDVEARRRALHGLEDKALKAALKLGYNSLTADKATRDELASQGFTTGQLDSLFRFREVKADMYNRAIAANKYSNDIYELASDISGSVVELSIKRNISEREAYAEYFKNINGPNNLAIAKFASAVESLNAISGGGKTGEDSLTWKELVTFFVMTSYASTLIMGKTFEVQYSTQLMAERRLATAAYESARNIRNSLDEIKDVVEPASGKTYGQLFGQTRGFATDTLNAASRLRRDGTPLGAFGALIDQELGMYDSEIEHHSKVSGLILIMQQMAREAIKPKPGEGSKSLIERIRITLAGIGPDSDFVASAMDEAENSVRVRGLEAIYKIVEGKTFKGEDAKVDVKKWGYSKATFNANGEINRADNAAGWDIAYHDIKAALTDYYSTQIDALFATGVTTERVQQMYDVDKTGFNPLFGNSDGVKKAQEAIRGLVAGAGGNIDEKGLLDAHKALVKDYLDDRMVSQTMTLINQSIETSNNKGNITKYKSALDSGDAMVYNRAASRLSVEDKIQVLAGSTARGKIGNEEGLKFILEDIFGTFSGEGAAARFADTLDQVSKSASFKDQMIKMHRDFTNTGDLSGAIRRAARVSAAAAQDIVNMNTKELERLYQIRTDAALIEDPKERGEQVRKVSEEIEATKANHAAQKIAHDTNNSMLKSIAEAMGGHIETNSATPLNRPAQDHAIVNAAIHKASKGRVGAAASGLFANVLIPTAMGGLGGAAGMYMDGQADRYGKAWDDLGAMSGAAVVYSNPLNMLNDLSGHAGNKEMVARTLSGVIALGAAAGAGHAAGLAVAHMSPGGNMGLKMLGASAVVGMLVGSVVGEALEAISIQHGWSKNRGGMMSAIATEIHDASDEYLASVDGNLEEIMGGDETFVEEHAVMLADGEMTAVLDFYSTHNATKSSDETGDSSDYATDIDSHVTGMSFASYDSGGTDGLYFGQYGGSDNLHDMG